MRNLKSLRIFFLMLFFMPLAVMADNNLIDIVGKHRTITQQIAKAYIFDGMGIRPDAAKSQIRTGLVNLTKNTKILTSGITDAATLGILAAMETEIQQYSEILQQPYSKGNAAKALLLSESILNFANDVATNLEQSAGSAHARVIALSAKLSMLSQQAAKWYIASKAGFSSPENQGLLRKTAEEFDAGYAVLLNEPANNRRITSELKRADKLWNMVRKYFVGNEKGDLPVTIFTLTDSVSEKMDKVHDMYMKL